MTGAARLRSKSRRSSVTPMPSGSQKGHSTHGVVLDAVGWWGNDAGLDAAHHRRHRLSDVGQHGGCDRVAGPARNVRGSRRTSIRPGPVRRGRPGGGAPPVRRRATATAAPGHRAPLRSNSCRGPPSRSCSRRRGACRRVRCRPGRLFRGSGRCARRVAPTRRSRARRGAVRRPARRPGAGCRTGRGCVSSACRNRRRSARMRFLSWRQKIGRPVTPLAS